MELKILMTIFLMGVFLIFSGCTSLSNTIIVFNQNIYESTVIVDTVYITENGWVVIYNDDDNTLGEIIGISFIEKGINTNVIVTVDSQRITQTLYAVLHFERGEERVFEPDVDIFVEENSEIVISEFRVANFEDFRQNFRFISGFLFEKIKNNQIPPFF